MTSTKFFHGSLKRLLVEDGLVRERCDGTTAAAFVHANMDRHFPCLTLVLFLRLIFSAWSVCVTLCSGHRALSLPSTLRCVACALGVGVMVYSEHRDIGVGVTLCSEHPDIFISDSPPSPSDFSYA